MVALAERLRDTIMAYCLYMEADTLDELGGDVASGALGWFPAEFEEAITTGALTPGLWARLTQTGLDDDDYEALDADLREVWSHISPERPYPEARLGRKRDRET